MSPSIPDQFAFQNLREEYRGQLLELENMPPNPLTQLAKWIEEAVQEKVTTPNAIILATVDSYHRPSQRAVLIKSLNISKKNIVFCTNIDSPKSQDIQNNSYVSALFPWFSLHRQVRVQGTAHMIPRAEAEQIFNDRPRDSQISSWVSAQSKKIESRQHLIDQHKIFKDKFKQQVPCPPFWCGYSILPDYFEFWQGQESRLHNRIAYSQNQQSNQWSLSILAP